MLCARFSWHSTLQLCTLGVPPRRATAVVSPPPVVTFACLRSASRVPALALSRSDHLFKLVLIGDSGVGKSCLLLRFAVRGWRDAVPASVPCPHCRHVVLP